jgi:hypothetical protein
MGANVLLLLLLMKSQLLAQFKVVARRELSRDAIEEQQALRYGSLYSTKRGNLGLTMGSANKHRNNPTQEFGISRQSTWAIGHRELTRHPISLPALCKRNEK